MVRSKRWAGMFFAQAQTYEGNECLIWPYAKIRGYAAIRVEGRTEYVSRLLCPGEPTTEAPYATHTCGNGAHGCVTKKHLVWKSQKENKDDELEHGTRNFGRRNGANKLTEDEVHEIRRRLARGGTHLDVADAFGVSRWTVRDIDYGKTWKWLKTEKEKANGN